MDRSILPCPKGWTAAVADVFYRSVEPVVKPCNNTRHSVGLYVYDTTVYEDFHVGLSFLGQKFNFPR